MGQTGSEYLCDVDTAGRDETFITLYCRPTRYYKLFHFYCDTRLVHDE
jgi:hypothetical protein